MRPPFNPGKSRVCGIILPGALNFKVKIAMDKWPEGEYNNQKRIPNGI